MVEVEPAAPRPASDLKLRVMSALALAAAALAATASGGWPFTFIWLAAAALITHEFLTISGARTYFTLLVSVVGVLLAGLWADDMAETSARIGVGAPHGLVLLPALLAGGVAALLAPSGVRRWALLAAPYAGMIAAAPVIARGSAVGGIVLVLWMYATVWFTDIAAYFAGRRFGGPKLWPAVSPKKTWSGAIAGALAGLAAGLGIVVLFGRPPMFASWSILGVAIFTLSAAIASEAGDLAESAMKRRFNVKDSGHLIPGHGGLMDRLDGFWAVCVVLLMAIIASGA
ncbi:MAG: phosphatidate cytidylyltransferase [Beijerinckiaceae bacterium]